MKQEVRILLEIIKYYLNKDDEFSFEKNEVNWEDLFAVAIRHNVLNFVYYYVEELGIKKHLENDVYQYLFRTAMYEMTKSYNQIYAAEELLDAFEKQGICALAVKGICAKYYYPQYDMRSMGDIDILYQASQQPKLKRVMKQLEYKQSAEGRKHDCYIREPFIAVEMHRELVATDSEYNSYYKDIWNKLKRRDNRKYIYEMSLEDEYIYSLVHLVEHFRSGGIGIRFVMDVYVYNKMEQMNWDYIEKELRQLKIWDFYKKISLLAEMWFGTEELNNDEDKSLMDKLSRFIVSNGVFGTQKNSAAIAVAREGKVVFLLKAIFPNLKNMQSMFTWLKQWPILLPYAWCLRGVRSIVYRRDNIKTQINRYKFGDKAHGEELRKFLKECGL